MLLFKEKMNRYLEKVKNFKGNNKTSLNEFKYKWELPGGYFLNSYKRDNSMLLFKGENE